MRYYLPGSLFLIYMMILVIVNLPAQTIKTLSQEALVGIFTGAFVASPTIGYLIYAFYNHLYEHWAGDVTKRPALKYLEDLSFTSEKNRPYIRGNLRCFIQKKEFLDLIYHSSSNNGEMKIDTEILNTLKNHLSAFAARIVCGFFVPIFCIPSFLLVWKALSLINIDFAWNALFTIFSILAIAIISIVLLIDCMRVLYEAYQLEVYMIKTKSKEIEELCKKLFPCEDTRL